METQKGKLTIEDLTRNGQSFPGEDMRPTAEAIKMELQSPAPNTSPFKVPIVPNYTAFVSLFLELAQDEWGNRNLIVVLFNSADRGRIAGIAPRSDKNIWESEAGKRHLKSSDTTIYSITDYALMIFEAYKRDNPIGDGELH